MSKLDISGSGIKFWAKEGQRKEKEESARQMEATIADREQREKLPPSPLDGRVLRGKGKNIALNFRVTEDFKKRFIEAAGRHNLTMTEILERAFEAFETSEKGKK